MGFRFHRFMMTRTSIIISFLLFGAWLDAAAQATVRIVDAEEGIPLPYAFVRFTCLSGDCADSIRMQSTDRNGTAAIPFEAPVAVAARSLGYVEGYDTLRQGESAVIRLVAEPWSGETVVVTGQYAPTGSDRSLYDVRVISNEEIDRRAAQDLRDLMGGELNVRLGQDNVLGSSMSVQGVSGQNVKILIDGTPVVGRVAGNIDISQIPLNNVERVELVEGPLSTVYGTDALGGVVNLITDRKAASGITAEANAYHESAGTWNADGRVSALLGTTRLMVSGGRNLFDGFSRPDTSRFMRWKPREQYFADWDGTWFAGDFALSYTGRLFDEYILNRGIPRPPYGETAFDETYRTDRITNRVQARGEIGEHRIELSAALSNYTRRRNTFFRNLVTLEQQPTATPSDHDTVRFDSWNVRGSASGDADLFNSSWQAGFEAGIDNASGDRIDSIGRSAGDYAMYASVRSTPVPRLTVQPGLRYAYNTNYDAPLIPSLNVKYEPAARLTIRASYARGFRAPSLRDLYFLFVDVNHNIRGNTDLRAETSDNFQASLSWKRATASDLLEATAGGFYNDIRNLITLANVGGDLYSYENVGTYRTAGLKLGGRYRREGVTTAVGASLIGRYNAFSDESDVPALLFSPEVTASASWKIPGIAELAFDYKYTGRLPSYALDADGNLVERCVDDYHTLNASAGRSFGDDLVTVRIGGKNLFDVTDVVTTAGGDGVHDAGASSLPVSWGRSFFIDINVAIK